MTEANDLPGLFGDRPTEHSTSELRGLVAACLDGMVTSFEYCGLRVVSNGEDFDLLQDGRSRGRLHVIGDPIEGTVHWLECKAELYASNTDE
jgi:hypothetical protein